MKRWIQLEAVLSLGVLNVLRVVWYRLLLKLELHPGQKIPELMTQGPYFKTLNPKTRDLLAPTRWQTHGLWFGHKNVTFPEGIPNWHHNPYADRVFPSSDMKWWKIPDFDPQAGDIKTYWEASRFDWVVSMSQRAATGDFKVLEDLNVWLENWIKNNPPYRGPNWKCGQEASIRVLHLTAAAMILEQTEMPLKSLTDLISVHLQRVAPTMSYAVAQDNNHGTSEAAALFVGGAWLERLGRSPGLKWKKTGRKWLENRVDHLISADGSFSQYSMNYHRMMIDTLSFVEISRTHFNQSEFSKKYYERASAATHWLHTWIDKTSGDAPNLGANDGAKIIPLTDAGYRDFRPSLQLAAAVFLKARAQGYSDESDSSLAWFNIQLPLSTLPEPSSRLFDNGGYAFLSYHRARLLIRYPRYKFRPSHADALHVDFWLEGENIFRDGGTYSYNTDAKWVEYFAGTESHNTVQFDGRDQMPRISRFLFGKWLKTSTGPALQADSESISFTAGYRDYREAQHSRTIRLGKNSLIVKDQISGFTEQAVLRWRVAPGTWVLSGNVLTNKNIQIKILSPHPCRIELEEGFESRYYLAKEVLPVLKVILKHPGEVISEVSWSL